MKFSKSTNLVLLAACSGALFFSLPEQPSDSQVPAFPTQTVVSAKSTAKSQKITQTDVTADQAIKAFQDEHPKSDVTALTLEKKQGKYSYEVEGLSNSEEHELKVSAQNKKVSDKGTETLDQVEQKGVKRQEEKLNTKDLLTVKQAVKKAQEKVKSGNVIEVSLDKELGITYWQVEFEQSDKEISVNINANNGKFLSKETSELDD